MMHKHLTNKSFPLICQLFGSGPFVLNYDVMSLFKPRIYLLCVTAIMQFSQSCEIISLFLNFTDTGQLYHVLRNIGRQIN